jgi:hypothetical protein
MTWVGPAIVAVKTVILLLGAAITYIAYKAYRQTGSPSIRLLGIGFTIVTLGSLLAGIADQVLGVSLEVGVLLNSILVAVGFVTILYSLYLERG